MISSRYAPHLALLLVIALIPTVIHVYAGLDEDDGRSTTLVPERLAEFSSRPTDRRPAWGRAVFDSNDWFERLYEKGGIQVRLFVGRSFNQKRLYHHPEIGLSRGVDLEPAQVRFLPGWPQWPIHLMRQKDGTGYAAYLLLYGDEFIENPVANQLRESVWQMFNPRRPMTLFYVAQQNVPRGTPFEKTAAARLLVEAAQSFLEPGGGR